MANYGLFFKNTVKKFFFHNYSAIFETLSAPTTIPNRNREI